MARSGIAVAVVCRPAATAPIGPLAWEHPNATGAALKRQKTKKKKKKDREREKKVSAVLAKGNAMAQKPRDHVFVICH